MSAALKVATTAWVALLLLAGCTEPEPEMREVKISGSAALPDGSVPQGTLHIQAYHAWYGTGDLRHPLKELGGFEGPPAQFSGSVSYVPGEGEGLVIHAWLDTDGDGVHCTPTVRTEPAGLVVAAEFPADEVSVSLTLTENCASANWFFPP